MLLPLISACADIALLIYPLAAAMLIHFLSQVLPGSFAAIVPVFGLPLLGYLLGPRSELLARRAEAVRTTHVLQLHDLTDTVIPWQGGRSADGWL